MALMVTGAVALPLSVSGQQFTVSASSLSTGTTTDRSEFAQFGTVDLAGGTTPTGVAVNVIQDATLADLDQVVCAALPATLGGGFLKVEIKANPAIAHNLVVDATSLTGDATFTNIQIGVTPTGYAVGVDPRAQGFAQIADNASISNLHQVALFTSAGTFTLKGLNLTSNIVTSCS